MVCLGTYQDRVIYMIIYAAIHLGAWLVIEPVLEGKTCTALPSATAFLIIYGILSILCLPIELYNNWKRIGKDLDPQMDVHVIPGEGELYPSHKTLAILYSALGLTTLFIGVCWGFPMWIVQTVRGGSLCANQTSRPAPAVARWRDRRNSLVDFHTQVGADRTAPPASTPESDSQPGSPSASPCTSRSSSAACPISAT